jgi:hypothetical protein
LTKTVEQLDIERRNQNKYRSEQNNHKTQKADFFSFSEVNRKKNENKACYNENNLKKGHKLQANV